MAGRQAGRQAGRESHRSSALRAPAPTCAIPARSGSGSRPGGGGGQPRGGGCPREEISRCPPVSRGSRHGTADHFWGRGWRPGGVGADGAARRAGSPERGRTLREAPGRPSLHQGGGPSAHRGPSHPLWEGGPPGETLCRRDQGGPWRLPFWGLLGDSPHQEEAALQNPPEAHHHQRGQESVKRPSAFCWMCVCVLVFHFPPEDPGLRHQNGQTGPSARRSQPGAFVSGGVCGPMAFIGFTSWAREPLGEEASPSVQEAPIASVFRHKGCQGTGSRASFLGYRDPLG